MMCNLLAESRKCLQRRLPVAGGLVILVQVLETFAVETLPEGFVASSRHGLG